MMLSGGDDADDADDGDNDDGGDENGKTKLNTIGATRQCLRRRQS